MSFYHGMSYVIRLVKSLDHYLAHARLVFILAKEKLHILRRNVIAEAGDQPGITWVMRVEPLTKDLRCHRQGEHFARFNYILHDRAIVQ